MIAISSLKPFGLSREVTANQERATDSWKSVFTDIKYFGKWELGMDSLKTRFIEEPEWPTIKQMAEVAGAQTDWVCLLNADIVLSNRCQMVFQTLKQPAWGAKCGLSKRYEFDPVTQDFLAAKIVDEGLDFFFAEPRIWRRVAHEIPEEFKIGHILFDTWLLAFFMAIAPGECYDVTPCRLVFHPKHGDRGDQSMDHTIGRNYIDRVRWPMSFKM